MLRFLTAGESHGQCLTAILEGLPAGLKINIDEMNKKLARRQMGYGRGGRMKIETDKADILSGVRFATLVNLNRWSVAFALNKASIPRIFS